MPILDAWNRQLGNGQGRIAPDGITPINGTYVMCLGFDEPLRAEDLSPGDFAQVEQTALRTPTAKLIRVVCVVRPPKTIPTGHKWMVQLLLNDKVAIEYRLKAGGRTRVRQFAINTSKMATGVPYNLTVRLAFLTDDSHLYIVNASYDMGTGNDVLLPIGIPSAAAVGSGLHVAYLKTITPTGIATAQAMGSANKLNKLINGLSGIASAQAMGATTLLFPPKTINGLSGIASAQAMGSDSLVKQINGLSGIASAQAMGSDTLTRTLNPANSALTMWERSFPNSSPWSGVASTGVSGTQTLATSGTIPGASTLNGLGTATFNGTTQSLVSNNVLSTYISQTAESGWALVNITSIATNLTSGFEGNDCILAQNGTAHWCIYLRSGGGTPKVGLKFAEVTTLAEINVECNITTGAWQLVQWKRDTGTGRRIRVNSSAWTSLSGDNVDTIATTMFVGKNPGATHFMTGSIAEIGIINSFQTDAFFDNLVGYINLRYALAL